jgi:hypothetical protein
MRTRRLWQDLCLLIVASLWGCSGVPSAPALPPVLSNPQAEQARIVQAMQKKLRERDRQIQQLRAQLETLKLIDQEHEGHRKVRPPASLEHPPQ